MKDILYLICIGFIWGATNPFLKRGSQRMIEGKQYDHIVMQFIYEQYMLYSNLSYLVPFLVNTCGSALYYYMLSISDLSIFIPFTNALTLSCTLVVSILLGETTFHKYHIAGIACIALGGYTLSLS